MFKAFRIRQKFFANIEEPARTSSDPDDRKGLSTLHESDTSQQCGTASVAPVVRFNERDRFKMSTWPPATAFMSPSESLHSNAGFQMPRRQCAKWQQDGDITGRTNLLQMTPPPFAGCQGTE